MKLPNVASLVALCLVLIPAVQAGIEQVYPAAEWFWSPLIVTALGALAKWLQERRISPALPSPPEVVSFSPQPNTPQPNTWRKVLLG